MSGAIIQKSDLLNRENNENLNNNTNTLSTSTEDGVTFFSLPQPQAGSISNINRYPLLYRLTRNYKTDDDVCSVNLKLTKLDNNDITSNPILSQLPENRDEFSFTEREEYYEDETGQVLTQLKILSQNHDNPKYPLDNVYSTSNFIKATIEK